MRIMIVSTVEQPSYEDLAALVVVLTEQLTQAHARIAALEAEVAALRARLDKDSTNSSTPPSADSMAAKAKRKTATSQRVRSKDRKRGGQVGRTGSGLVPTSDPDRTEQVEAATECSGCRADLVTRGTDAGTAWAQVWDILPIVLEKVHYLLPQQRCGCCGKLTTAAAPFGRAGTVSYGPNVNAAAILLASQGNVPVEATAKLMAALLGTGDDAARIRAWDETEPLHRANISINKAETSPCDAARAIHSYLIGGQPRRGVQRQDRVAVLVPARRVQLSRGSKVVS
jgi:Family of unknown function (DUF6444)